MNIQFLTSFFLESFEQLVVQATCILVRSCSDPHFVPKCYCGSQMCMFRFFFRSIFFFMLKKKKNDHREPAFRFRSKICGFSCDRPFMSIPRGPFTHLRWSTSARVLCFTPWCCFFTIGAWLTCPPNIVFFSAHSPRHQAGDSEHHPPSPSPKSILSTNHSASGCWAWHLSCFTVHQPRRALLQQHVASLGLLPSQTFFPGVS